MSYMVKLDTKLLAVSDLENYDTNGCTDFIDLYGFFLEQMLGFRQKIKKIRTNR
jgi:hypothetical protein